MDSFDIVRGICDWCIGKCSCTNGSFTTNEKKIIWFFQTASIQSYKDSFDERVYKLGSDWSLVETSGRPGIPSFNPQKVELGVVGYFIPFRGFAFTNINLFFYKLENGKSNVPLILLSRRC